MITWQTVLFSLFGGILPALVWLVFWLAEDTKRPEPRGLLVRTFFFGMMAVIIVIPFQTLVERRFPDLGVTTFALWAVLEEGFKFLAAWFGGLRSIEDDEPIDPVIYMLTAALGFVAFENTLFIASPLLAHNIAGGLITGGLRFVGANILHVIASGTLGVALAFTFYRSWPTRFLVGLIGFAGAVFFHTAFNLAIVNRTSYGSLLTFGSVWAGVAILLWMFERVKAIPRRAVSPRHKE